MLPATELSASRRALIVLVMLVAFIFSPLDYSLLEPALPAIQHQYAVSEQNISWTYTLLAMAMMVSAPLVAKLSDTRGRRLAFGMTMTVFALGTLTCALAPSYGILLLGRVIQGLGSGGIAPLVAAVIGDHIAQHWRGTVLSLMGVVVGIGLLAGPVVGNLALQIGWQTLFFVFAPFIFGVGLLGYTLMRQIEPAPGSRSPQPFDALGLLLLILTVATLMFGLTQIKPNNFFGTLSLPPVWSSLLAALLFLVLLVRIERRAPNPLLAVNAFRSHQVVLAASLALGYGFTRTALAFLPELASALFREPVTDTVALLLPLGIALILGSLSAGALVDRIGTKPVVLTGMTALTVGVLLFSSFAANEFVFLLAGLLVGAGSAVLVGAPVRYMFLNEFPASTRGAGQGLFAVMWALGQQLSGILIGSLLAANVQPACRGVGAATVGCEYALGGYASAYIAIGAVLLVLTLAALGLKSSAAERATVTALAQQ